MSSEYWILWFLTGVYANVASSLFMDHWLKIEIPCWKYPGWYFGAVFPWTLVVIFVMLEASYRLPVFRGKFFSEKA